MCYNYSMKKTIILFLIISSLVSFGESFVSKGQITVLVTDSGSDFTHNLLKPVGYADTAELNGTAGVDDSGSGYADDVYGWNFVENNNVLVNLEHTPPNYDDLLRFGFLLDVLSYFPDQITQDDYNFLVANYTNENINWLNFVGGWAHGTHCAGIIGEGSDFVKMKAIKHIQTGNPPRIAEELREFLLNSDFRKIREQWTDEQMLALFQAWGEQSKQENAPRRDYVEKLNPRVVNCSYGSDNPSLLVNIKGLMVGNFGYTDPDTAEVQRVVNMLVEHALIPGDEEMYSKVPNALIVIAAGNSAEDNDELVISPNDMKIDNKIIVAATVFDMILAPYSCYGKEKVDIAASGTLIYATYPNQKKGYMSGTSMATPYVSRVAAEVLYINPSFTAVELKKVLMETVDKKEWLKDKVKSGGVVNSKRAKQVAKWVRMGMDIDKAIAKAKLEVLTPQVEENYRLPYPADDPRYRMFVY